MWVFRKKSFAYSLYYYQLPVFEMYRVNFPQGEKASLNLGYSLPDYKKKKVLKTEKIAARMLQTV